MNPTVQPHLPWLVAVWPGMGHVALTAGYYLMAKKMGMRQFAEFSARELFDIDAATIHDGVVAKPVWPQSRLFVWEGGEQHRDVIVFIGEAQPPDTYTFPCLICVTVLNKRINILFPRAIDSESQLATLNEAP